MKSVIVAEITETVVSSPAHAALPAPPPRESAPSGVSTPHDVLLAIGNGKDFEPNENGYASWPELLETLHTTAELARLGNGLKA